MKNLIFLLAGFVMLALLNTSKLLAQDETVKDLKEIPDNIKQDLTIKPVRWIDEVLTEAINGYTERTNPKGSKSKKLKTLLAGVKKIKIRKNDRIRAH